VTIVICLDASHIFWHSNRDVGIKQRQMWDCWNQIWRQTLNR